MTVPLRCLLVEDSDDDAQLVLYRLRSAGFEVSAERVDNADALRAALDRQLWDIVISDYRMPGFTGMDALAMMRARDGELPFILISGQMGEELAVEAMRAGASDYLTKDSIQRLAAVVQRELHEAVARRAHQQAAAALRLSAKRHQAILDTALDGYLLLDSRGRMLEVNHAYAVMTGYSIHELLGMSFVDLEVGVSAADIAERLQRIIRLGYERFETRNRRKDGSEFDVEVSVQSNGDDDPQFVCFLRDISAHKQAENELLASNQNLQATLDASPDLFFEMGLDGRYHRYHSPQTELLAAPPERLLGKLVTEVLPAEAAATVLAALNEAAENRTSHGKEIKLALAGGEKWFELSVARKVTLEGAPPRFVVLSRDISARKQAEAADAFLAQVGVGPDGEPFFQALARFLATNLQMDYLCIDRLEGDQLTDGGFEDSRRYSLADTPCGQVSAQKICCYPASVTAVFPGDAALQALHAESYIGVPLLGHTGLAIGLIAAIGRRPLTNRASAEHLLLRMAPRAAAELERLAAEAALIASEARNRAVAHSAHDGIATADEAGLIVGWNQGAEAMFGYTEAEAIGQPMTLPIPGRHRDQYLDAREQVGSGGSQRVPGRVTELTGLRKDGTKFPLELSLARWETSDGWFMTGIIRDISERKLAEEAVRTSHAVLAKFNALAVGRELRMVELKQEINELCARLGEPPRHRVVSGLASAADSD